MENEELSSDSLLFIEVNFFQLIHYKLIHSNYFNFFSLNENLW